MPNHRQPLVIDGSRDGPQQRVDVMQEQDRRRQEDQISSIDEFYQNQIGESQQLNEARRQADLKQVGDSAREAEKAGRYQRAASGNVGGSQESVQKAELGAAITRQVGQTELAARQRMEADQGRMRQNFQQEISSVYQRNPYYKESMNALMQGFDIQSTASQQRFQTQQLLDQSRALYGQRLGQIIGNAISIGGQTYGNYLEYGGGRAQ